MKRIVPIILLVAVVAVLAIVVLSSREDEQGYQVRAIFDNAGFVIPGEDVKIAGVKVGKVQSLDVTDDFKAAVVLDITEPGYQDFRRDASCIVRPQNLIGERFVECKPTQPRSSGSSPPPPLEEITDGPGEGQLLLPVSNTMQTVDIDLIGNSMREPERARLSLILNELGTGLAGRGRDLNDIIRRANPALQETDKVLAILAKQNSQLEQLAVNSDKILAPLARDRASVGGAIRNTAEVAQATAEERVALAADIETLPEFLDELTPTMVSLGNLADASTPVLTDLGANAPAINSMVERLGPFSSAAMPAVDALGEATKTGTPAVIAAQPVVADLAGLAKAVRPVAVTLAGLLVSLRDTGGIERLMDYIFYQAAAINGFDSVGHYLRAELLVNQCATYAIEPLAGCSANFPVSSASSSSVDATTSAVKAAGDDPVLRATAIALARALGKEVEKVKTQVAAEGKTPAGGKSKRSKTSDDEPLESVPTVAPGATGTPAPDAGTPVAPVATAAPAETVPESVPTVTPTPASTAPPAADPADALLDYLFGKDGG